MIKNFDELKQAVNNLPIKEVVGRYLSLKKAGVNYKGICPFHTEKTPSFSVSPSKNIYKCFGCGKAGGPARFIMEMERLTFIEALRFLAKAFNLTIEEGQISDKDTKKLQEKESIFHLNKMAFDFFLSKKGRKVSSFSKERGFDKVIADKFNLGYAPKEWAGFVNHAKGLGFSEEQLIKAGLASEKEGKVFDKFRDRIIFPRQDLYGKVLSFSGRTLEKDGKPKYLNSPETKVFVKSDSLYGLYQAKNTIIKANNVFLVEGPTDVIAFHKGLTENVVSSDGTAFTEKQAKLLKRFADTAIICFDGDDAGIKATKKAISICLKVGLKIEVLQFGKVDPDEFIRENGVNAFQECLKKTENWFDYILKAEDAKLNTADEKSEAVKGIMEMVNAISDSITRQEYTERLMKERNVQTTMFEVVEDNEDNFYCTHFIENNKSKCIQVFASKERAVDFNIKNNKQLAIAYTGGDATNEIIDKLTGNSLLFDLSVDAEDIFHLGASLIVAGIRNIEVKDKDDIPTDFFNWLSGELDSSFYKLNNTEKSVKLNQLSRFVAQLDEATRAVEMPRIASSCSLSYTRFKELVAPELKKVKEKEKQRIQGNDQQIDLLSLPDYVDEADFNRKGFFMAQNSQGNPTHYVFRKADNSGVDQIFNFAVVPLFHIFDEDDKENKRVIMIHHRKPGRKAIALAVPSADMLELTSFKKHLYSRGDYVFGTAKPQQYQMILEAMEFPTVHKLKFFGRQKNGVFAFSNVIVDGENIVPMDENGMVTVKDRILFQPPPGGFAGLYEDEAENTGRYFKYREGTLTFSEWTKLMLEVYKVNDNGHWSILFALLAAFRSHIFKIDQLFTSLFFIGPTECGKSQIAQSIRALFIDPSAPLFNLNFGTPAAFFESMRAYRDVPVIYEEYNDTQVPDKVFQGLKAAIYDNTGRQKMDGNNKNTTVSEVNCAPVLLGQEVPERDDGALANRCILRHIKKKENYTPREIEVFQQLKSEEKKGLSHLGAEVAMQLDVIKDQYAIELRKIEKEFMADLKENKLRVQTRIIKTTTLFLAICRTFEKHIPQLPLNFTYDEFYVIAKNTAIEQTAALDKTSRLTVFFNTLEVLFNAGYYRGIHPGREFKIEEKDMMTTKKEGKDKTYNFEKPKKILFLRVRQLIHKYNEIEKGEALKPHSLQIYLEGHPAFMGQIKTRFYTFTESVKSFDADNPDVGQKYYKGAPTNPTTAMAFDYEMIENMGICLHGEDLNVIPSEKKKKDEKPVKKIVEPAKSDEQEEEIPF